MTFDTLPEALKAPLRIAVLSALFNGEKDFRALKDILKVTDGNLSVQLNNLETYGCIGSIRVSGEKRRRTLYRITDEGKKLLTEYVALLSRSIGEDN
ncbi:MAG: transcriptional regulator [Lachnospiraceae bacterium]|nr:transcriptional regulator [Lachnospiraceae bacterium]